jgi:superfamily I DNA and/or RNA helicase
MWKKTNMPAQVKMMEEAGLNPALMYGMSGGGGTTAGSQGGGSASGGSAPGERSMDLSASLMGAEIAKKIEEAKDLASQRKKRDDSETRLDEARIGDLTQGIQNKKAEEELTKVNTKIGNVELRVKDARSSAEIESAFVELGKLKREAKGIGLDNDLKGGTLENNIKTSELQVVGMALDNQFKEVNIEHSEAKIKEIANSIEQKWFKLHLEKGNMNIQRFKAELEAEYPGLAKVWGKMANDVYDLAGYLDHIWGDKTKGGIFQNPKHSERKRGIDMDR